MTDKPLFLLDAKARWRLAHDSLQWIVQRRDGSSRRCDIPGARNSGWRGVAAFIAGEKRVLPRVLREKSVVLTAEAQARLDALPEKFQDFLVERGDLVPPAVPSRAA